jgi:hypothetical protein
VYKRVPDTVTDQSISNFFGSVVDNPNVIASKISNAEREELDSPLSIQEFDKALEKAKCNTSPGIDSISNRFIKHFWYLFRKPLFDYANTCYTNGMLTTNFRCAPTAVISRPDCCSFPAPTAVHFPPRLLSFPAPTAVHFPPRLLFISRPDCCPSWSASLPWSPNLSYSTRSVLCTFCTHVHYRYGVAWRDHTVDNIHSVL